MSTPNPHQELILDQFTRQAAIYADAPAINHEASLRPLVACSGAGSEDVTLDVACGAGQAVCAFAKVVRQASGIDLVPAMIEKARALQTERQLTNVIWQVGDVARLPFADGAFTIVTSRYAFHHLPQPGAVLAEMKRVCAPGGRIVVADVIASADANCAVAFNRMEKLRDPSHVRALSLAELQNLFAADGLSVICAEFYPLELDVETLLQGSFPNPGDADRVRQLFVDSLTTDALGLHARRAGDVIRFGYPIAVLVGTGATL